LSATATKTPTAETAPGGIPASAAPPRQTALAGRRQLPFACTELGEVYRAKVAALREQLSTSQGDNSAMLERRRDLIDRVAFGPGENGEPEITLTGASAAMVFTS
jgi:hypothetical protein